MQGKARYLRLVPDPRDPAPQPGNRRQARRGATGAAGVLAAVAGLTVLISCSGQSAVKLPPRSSSPHLPSAPATPAAGPAAAVTAAYTAYFPVLTAAEAAPASRAEAMLAPYAAQPYLGHVLSQMAAYRARHEVSRGYLVPHVTSVQVSGKLATVRDCQDASRAALADSRTGTVIPGTTGSARTYLIATLARGAGGRWRLTSLAHVAVSCAPVSSPSSS
jgi:hypothetical protein